jgi:tRNA/rRNA methyltransferase
MKNMAIILVNPQMGENIGAAARAMLNFGITDLRIVNPRDGWPNERATSMSAGAFDVMPAPHVFESFEAAIADCHATYATTARLRYMAKPVFTPTAAANDAVQKQRDGKTIGLVFGGERNGLDNEDIALCQNIINIPTNPEFSSLNLGQAVLLIAHEMHKAQDDTPAREMLMGESQPVPQGRLHEFFERLEGELDKGRFFRAEDLKPTMIRNIRNIFTRNELNEQEVKTLHGIVSALIGNKTNNGQ